jgi:histidyl-tRNA synthetase
LPEDIRRREYVVGAMRDVNERYGFEPLETPAFENIETLLGKYGEEGSAIAGVEQLTALTTLCADRAAERHLRIDSSLARGLSYYTGAMMEIAVPEHITRQRRGTPKDSQRSCASNHRAHLRCRKDCRCPAKRGLRQILRRADRKLASPLSVPALGDV